MAAPRPALPAAGSIQREGDPARTAQNSKKWPSATV